MDLLKSGGLVVCEELPRVGEVESVVRPRGDLESEEVVQSIAPAALFRLWKKTDAHESGLRQNRKNEKSLTDSSA